MNSIYEYMEKQAKLLEKQDVITPELFAKYKYRISAIATAF